MSTIFSKVSPEILLTKPATFTLTKLIEAYQVTLGAHFGGRCRFEPSCSNYGKEAIRVHGPGRGSWLTLKRLAKCGPWHRGGVDPVPPAKI